MTDTVDALARALFLYRTSTNILLPPDYWQRQSETMRQPFLAEAAAILAALAAKGLSIVKTADWERAQRVEAAAKGVTKVDDDDPMPSYWLVHTRIAALRAALGADAMTTPRPEALTACSCGSATSSHLGGCDALDAARAARPEGDAMTTSRPCDHNGWCACTRYRRHSATEHLGYQPEDRGSGVLRTQDARGRHQRHDDAGDSRGLEARHDRHHNGE